MLGTLLTPLALLLQDAPPAQDPSGAPATPPPPAGPLDTFLRSPFPMLILIGGVFYFLLIRPERKQRKAREALLSALQKGDQVMTSGGLYAVVVQVQGDVVTLQISEGVRARFARSAVQSVIRDGPGETGKDDKKAG